MVVKTVVEAQDIFDKAWEGFKGVDWKEKASISRFVQANYTPYDGDESFLAGPTERSLHIKKIVEETKAHYEETRFPMDTRPTSIADIPAGFIDKENELIFGIQNDEPLGNHILELVALVRLKSPNHAPELSPSFLLPTNQLPSGDQMTGRQPNPLLQCRQGLP